MHHLLSQEQCHIKLLPLQFFHRFVACCWHTIIVPAVSPLFCTFLLLVHLQCPSSRLPRMVTVWILLSWLACVTAVDVIEGIVITVSAFRLVQRFLSFFVVGALALSYVLPSMAVDFNRVSVATSLALRGEETGTTHHYLQLLVDNIALSYGSSLCNQLHVAFIVQCKHHLTCSF